MRILLLSLTALALLGGGAVSNAAPAEKSCLEICSARGGVQTGRQVQVCTSRCENTRRMKGK